MRMCYKSFIVHCKVNGMIKVLCTNQENRSLLLLDHASQENHECGFNERLVIGEQQLQAFWSLLQARCPTCRTDIWNWGFTSESGDRAVHEATQPAFSQTWLFYAYKQFWNLSGTLPKSLSILLHSNCMIECITSFCLLVDLDPQANSPVWRLEFLFYWRRPESH